MRIACLRVPRFPFQALLRAMPELAELPLAVAAGSSSRDVVVAVSPEAAERGLQPGVTVAQARQVIPEVEVRVTPGEATEAAAEALADVATSVSPRTKRTRPGEVLLDVGGLERRIGSEAGIAHELLRACHRVGLDGRVGIAAGCGVARIASLVGVGAPVPHPAEGSDPCVAVVEAGGERAFLAPLPLAVVAPPPDVMAQLLSWGLRRVGDLAALSRREVELRLGGVGTGLHRLACGEHDEAFIPDPVRETLKEGVHLEHPLVALEAFLFVLRSVLSRLEDRLELRGEGFSEVLLELALEGAERRAYRIGLVAPAREVAAVVALARLQLESDPPGSPVEGVAAVVTPGRVRMVQGSLFGPRLPAPGRLAVTLARLAAVVGADRVGAPAIPDTHRPGAFSLLSFAPTQQHRGISRKAAAKNVLESDDRLGVERAEDAFRAGCDAVGGKGGQRRSDRAAQLPRPVLRALRPPREAYVVAANDRPVVARVGRRGGAVLDCAGPYRIVGEWWDDDPFARDEFDVATCDGTVFRIFFDRRERRWYADGVYD